MDENSSATTHIGTIAATDNCRIESFSISSGNTDNAFAVDAAGELRVDNAAAIDYELTPEFILTILVTDEAGNSSAEAIMVRLNNLNDNAPAITAIPEITGNVLEEISFTATATDADDAEAVLHFSLGEGAAEGASIDAATGIFTWTPSEGQGPAEYIFVVIVSDGELSSSSEVLIKVLEPTGLFDSVGQERNTVLAYPNPTDGLLFVELEKVAAEEDVAISLYDLEGRLLLDHQGKLKQGADSISAYLQKAKAGVYLMQVKSKEQRQVIRLIRK